jgi:DNA polymerase-3 subunit alpha
MEEFVEKMHLRHLTYEGANRRYPEITEVIRERLDFELLTISNLVIRYFLIVQDLIAEAEVWVFLGRTWISSRISSGYCLKITNIDPLMYNLLLSVS